MTEKYLKSWTSPYSTLSWMYLWIPMNSSRASLKLLIFFNSRHFLISPKKRQNSWKTSEGIFSYVLNKTNVIRYVREGGVTKELAFFSSKLFISVLKGSRKLLFLSLIKGNLLINCIRFSSAIERRVSFLPFTAEGRITAAFLGSFFLKRRF